MKIKPINKKLKLYGFNNLTKTLSFNFFDICYALNQDQHKKYIAYIDEEYNADRLASILTAVAENEVISHKPIEVLENETPGPDSESVVAHLDKSHITVHTYPENHPDKGISTFRADIDVSTCGQISPLKALNFLLTSFEPDIAMIDYRVRGFTRDVNGKKYFIDHKINSIQGFIPEETKNKYQMIDVNVYQENIFHTKMLLKEFDLDHYLFGTEKEELSPSKRRRIKQRLKHEMLEIFYGRNVF